MKKSIFTLARLKKAGLIAAIMLAIGGAAYAILQSRDVLTGNTISTASSNLLLSTDGINYSHSVPGFNFENLIPAGYLVPKDGYSIYLKNAGSTPMSLQLALDDAPSVANPTNLNLINVALTDASGEVPPKGFILGSLANGGQPVNADLAPGAIRHYKFQALAADDVEPGMTISNIDFAFIGTAQDQNDPNL